MNDMTIQISGHGYCSVCGEDIGMILEMPGHRTVILCLDCKEKWHLFIFDDPTFVAYQHTAWEWEYLRLRSSAGIFAGFQTRKKIHDLMDQRRDLEKTLWLKSGKWIKERKRELHKRNSEVVSLEDVMKKKEGK